MKDEEKVIRAAEPPLVQSFGIRGLYGYKTVSLETDHAATILIAQNGSGKTTLLGAMDAFLRGHFTRLRGLEFEQIFCRVRGIEEELVLTPADLAEFYELPSDGDLVRIARKSELDPSTLFSFLVEEWPSLRSDRRLMMDNPTWVAIYRTSPSASMTDTAVFDRLREGIFSKTHRTTAIYHALQTALAGIEVIYLPTYRRIEIALPEEKDPRRAGRRVGKLFRGVPGSLHPAEIQFGLSDISDRLEEMNGRILSQSNVGYREISANIINELIGGQFVQYSGRAIPSRDELTLFFSRLQKSEMRMGPVGPHNRGLPITEENLNRLYGENALTGEGEAFLNYFLNKLDAVIKATHSVELQVEDFINLCNSYLRMEDASATVEFGGATQLVDAKELRFNREDLRVHVESTITNRKMPIDALSSGEKQMVSLFGKLYLYEKDKIVLIDEPELSLSIDWQRRILVDLLDAPSCKQIVAITHSPFVFDNELEPYARPLRVGLNPSDQGPSNAFNVDLV